MWLPSDLHLQCYLRPWINLDLENLKKLEASLWPYLLWWPSCPFIAYLWNLQRWGANMDHLSSVSNSGINLFPIRFNHQLPVLVFPLRCLFAIRRPISRMVKFSCLHAEFIQKPVFPLYERPHINKLTRQIHCTANYCVFTSGAFSKRPDVSPWGKTILIGYFMTRSGIPMQPTDDQREWILWMLEFIHLHRTGICLSSSHLSWSW